MRNAVLKRQKKTINNCFIAIYGFNMSGQQDSNLRPPAPKAGALTGLRYAPKIIFY